MKRLSAVLFVCLLIAMGAAAQGQDKSIFYSGILNPRAVTMPLPEYPEAARQARIGGLVAVNVVVDESGVVISAASDPYDQHTGENAKSENERRLDPTLLAAAELVARQATFKPFHIKGVPTKFSGKLIYNFVSDNSNLPPRIGEIYGPMVNNRAITLPEPEWPANLDLLHKTDTVTVHVTIDETGNVIAASAIGGQPALRPAAEAAALKAQFSPWKIQDEAVQTRGLITYTYNEKKP
jgi:outer membrane biosynthesis protein TonB